MSFFIADVNGYVGDLATNTGLNDLADHLLTLDNPPLKRLIVQGWIPVDLLAGAFDAITLHGSNQEVNDTLANLRALVEKCDEVVIISNGFGAEPLEKVSKKKDRIFKKVNPINRDRATIQKARLKLRTLLEGLFKEAKAAAKKLEIPQMVKMEGAVSSVWKVDHFEKIDPAIEAKVKEILAKLDLDGWALVMDDIDEILAEITRDGVYEALYQIGMSEENLTSKMSEQAVNWAREHSAELVGKKWVNGELIDNPNAEYVISEATRNMLRGDVAKAMEEGWSSQQFADAIEENYAFSAERAEKIARTELAFADVAGNMITYRESGVVVGKEWLLGSEHDETMPQGDECDDNVDAGVIGLDEEFPSGDDAAPAHPD